MQLMRTFCQNRMRSFTHRAYRRPLRMDTKHRVTLFVLNVNSLRRICFFDWYKKERVWVEYVCVD